MKGFESWEMLGGEVQAIRDTFTSASPSSRVSSGAIITSTSHILPMFRYSIPIRFRSMLLVIKTSSCLLHFLSKRFFRATRNSRNSASNLLICFFTYCSPSTKLFDTSTSMLTSVTSGPDGSWISNKKHYIFSLSIFCHIMLQVLKVEK